MIRFIEIASAIIGILSFLWTIAAAFNDDKGVRTVKMFAGAMVVLTCLFVMYCNSGFALPWGKWESTRFRNGSVKYRSTSWRGDDQHNIEKTYDTDGNLLSEERIVNGKKEGLQKYWYQSGAILAEQEFHANKAHGKWVFWYENGQKFKAIQYSNDEAVGEAKSWNEDGSLIGVCKFQDAKPWEGTETVFEVAAGHLQLCAACEYKDGKKHGLYQEWYSPLRKRVEAHYVAGEQDGEFTRWYKSGELIAEWEMRKGQPLQVNFFGNEEYPQSTGKYKDGDPWDGTFVSFTEVGFQHEPRLASIYTMSEGRENGSGCFYYADGKVQAKTCYANGSRHGTWSFFYPTGNRMLQLEYMNGVSVGKQIAWNADGTVYAEGEWKDGKQWNGTFVGVVVEGQGYKFEEPKYVKQAESKFDDSSGGQTKPAKDNSTVGTMLRAIKNAIPSTVNSSGGAAKK